MSAASCQVATQTTVGHHRTVAIDWFGVVQRTGVSMRVQRVWGADICRDGGSYSLCFDSDDGHWYELFLKTRAFEGAGPSHEPPVICRDGANDGHAVQSLSWQEAKAFVAPMSFEGNRFEELRRVIDTEGGALSGPFVQ